MMFMNVMMLIIMVLQNWWRDCGPNGS
jgi:hypothetical protein